MDQHVIAIPLINAVRREFAMPPSPIVAKDVCLKRRSVDRIRHGESTEVAQETEDRRWTTARLEFWTGVHKVLQGKRMEVDTFGSNGVEKIVLDDHVEVDRDTMIDVTKCFWTSESPGETSLGVAKEGSITTRGSTR